MDAPAAAKPAAPAATAGSGASAATAGSAASAATAGNASGSAAPAGERTRIFPSAFRALGHRNYRLFFSGQLVSLIGTWMQTVAQSWLVYRLTGSELLLGLVGFVSYSPVFLLATLGGTVADRRDRRRILVATQSLAMALAFVLAALTLTGTVQVWHIFLLAGLLGLVNAFDIPARQAFSVELVGRADLQNAIALNSSVFNGARMVGPAVAGVTVAAISEGWCFAVNGASYLAVIAGLLAMRTVPRERTPSGGILAHLTEGLGYVRHTPPVRAILLMLGMASLVGMPYAVLMPVFAADVLKTGPSGLGWLMSCAGVGALGAALTLTLRREVRGLERWVAWASLAFGAALIAFAASRWFALSAVLLVVVGYCMMLQMASSNTLVQHMVPDRLRGRVMAVYSMMFMGMAPFGALFAGALAHRLGAPMTVGLGGVVCMAGSLALRGQLKSVREALG